MLSTPIPQPVKLSAKVKSACRKHLPKLKIGLGIVLAIVGIWVGWHLYRVLVGTNLHVVTPGKVYRSAQLSPDNLKQVISEKGIRTIVNLRGCVPFEPWYRKECEVTQQMDVCQVDVNLSATRVPSPAELRRLIQAIELAEYPVLFHCRRGVDRTGLATATALILRENASISQALGQWSIYYGRISVGKTARLERVFDYYMRWLKESGKDHSAANFRHWATCDYGTNLNRCKIEKCDLSLNPVCAGKPFVANVRVRNTSNQTWRFLPIRTGGFHLTYSLFQTGGKKIAHGRTGFFHAEVEPGKSIELTMPIASIDKSGSYMLLIDMMDEQRGPFFQMGSEPIEMILNVE